MEIAGIGNARQEAGGVVIIMGAIALVQLVDRRTRKADQASCAV